MTLGESQEEIRKNAPVLRNGGSVYCMGFFMVSTTVQPVFSRPMVMKE